MEEPLSTQPMPETAADYEAAIERLLTEVARLNQQMRGDRSEIERLKAESRQLRAETRSVLEKLGAAF